MTLKEIEIFEVDGKNILLSELIKGYKKSKSAKKQKTRAEQKRDDEKLSYALNPDVVISGAREIEIMDAQVSSTGKFIG